MLTTVFFTTLTTRLAEEASSGNLFVALGAGSEAWDESPPPNEDRGVDALINEIARKEVRPEDVFFLDLNGNVTDTPSPSLRFNMIFDSDEAVGTLRECGLFGGAATEDPNTGTLLAYYIHPRLQKTEGMTLERVIHINLTPLPYAPGARVTRYLGNSSTRELHDLEQVTSQCQVEEIRPDNRFYHVSPEAAQEMGYDFCAYCFGRDLSED